MKKFIHGVLIGYSAATLVIYGFGTHHFGDIIAGVFLVGSWLYLDFTTTFTDKDSK